MFHPILPTIPPLFRPFPLRRINSRSLSLGLLILLVAFLVAPVVQAATQTGPNFFVNTLADTDDGSCDVLGQGTGNQDCTLREAINAANAYGNGGNITFSVSGTITLGAGLPNITKNCTINGSGQSVTISGNDSVGIFQAFNQFQTVNFNALTIAHGRSNLGGIFVRYASINVTNCTFNDNYCSSGGGALYLVEASHTVVANCTFYNNSAPYGGGIFVAGVPNGAPSDARIYNSTFYNNHASFGTGAFNLAAADIYARNAPAEIRNTILVNTDGRPAGFGAEDNAQGLTYADASSIYNVDIDSQSFNATPATAAQINLGPLQNNGGPTKTMALLPGSVAINAGNNAVGNAPPINNRDQRDYDRIRPGDVTCDVGAFEAGSTGSLVVTTALDLAAGDTYANSLRAAVTYANSLSGPQTITFAPALGGQAVVLNAGWNNAGDNSALAVGGQLTIQGIATAPGITVTMATGVQRRHLYVGGSGNLTVTNLTFTNGSADFGGSIRNFGTLTVRGCTFTGNYASNDGGAVHGAAGSPSLVVENSTFSGNSTTNSSSAGALTSGAVQTTLRHLTVANNTAPSGGATRYSQSAWRLPETSAGPSEPSSA